MRAEGVPAGMPVVVATAGTQVAEAVSSTIICVGRQPWGVPDAALEVQLPSSCAETMHSADWLQRSSCLPSDLCFLSALLPANFTFTTAYQVLWGECISGALYCEDFKRLATAAGFTAPREICSSPIDITDVELQEIVGNARFRSVTYRLFKLPDLLETQCEDYGQTATYKVRRRVSTQPACQGKLGL